MDATRDRTAEKNGRNLFRRFTCPRPASNPMAASGCRVRPEREPWTEFRARARIYCASENGAVDVDKPTKEAIPRGARLRIEFRPFVLLSTS